MKILITTEPDDNHALLVKLSLEKKNHHVRLLFTADLPTRQRNSVLMDNYYYQWKNVDRYDSFLDNDYDVVWWRRARKPYVPNGVVYPGDYKFVMRENILFHESLTDNLAPLAWWVNPKAAATRANSKLLQLKKAVESGLTIPVTLCSNHPQDIRNFIETYHQEGVIYKPLCTYFWFEEEQISVCYTARVQKTDLSSDELLQFSPGIYQKEIKKKYELRIICFGDYLVTVKLNSQHHPKGLMDWRAIPENEMAIEPYQLPIALERKIQIFMQKMGLVFGSLDFIVTPEDEYIFLEVNEQGQFLWIEEYNPEFRLLEIFTDFLLHRRREFVWKPRKNMCHIDDYRVDMISLSAQNMRRHVFLNGAK